jgi:hypothetical protein
MFLGVFGLIGAVNWGYESKLLTPDPSGPGWNEVHLGQILLAIAAAQAGIGSAILLAIRLLVPNVTSAPWMLIPLTLVAIFLIFPSLFLVVLGPAAVTMVEQTRAAPR